VSKTVALDTEETPALPQVRPEAWPGQPGAQGPPSALVAVGSDAVSPRPIEKPGRGILWHRYRDRISYSSCNEDSGSEVQVLIPHASKRLVSICASGGRVLNLLQQGAEEVWAVDVNPSQTHLLELKVAGLRALGHADFLSFLGVRASQRRLDVYDSLRPGLSVGARAYFDGKPFLVERGVLYQGSLERFLARYVANAARLLRPRWVRRLFACTDLAEQRRLLPGWHGPFWGLVAKTICRRCFFRFFSHEPGFWRYLPPELRLHERIFGNIERYLDHHLARENHLLWLVFFGRYGDERVMPEYLREDGFARIKHTLRSVRLNVVNGDIAGILRAAPPRHFDGYSISDISAYLSHEAFGQTIEQVVRTARPGARLCSRGVFYHRPFLPEHASRLARDHAVEERLEKDDHAMVHAFAAAEIR
jgi:S-adenosylmethionine-diacylglycerol 3-amino-3-carboxypropyl transferase